MTDIKKARHFFIILSALILALMLILSRYSGINCDEDVHYYHSLKVIDFFTSHGNDKAAINTPVTHLQYYGQCYDNFTSILIRAFGIEDIYSFRHFMSTIAGWLTILVSALFAVWLSGYEAGIFVLLLFAISPTFLGHAQNNLKDIPFALGYFSGMFFSCRLIAGNIDKKSVADIIFLILSIALTIGTRAGGLIIVCFIFLLWAAVNTVEFVKGGAGILPEAIKNLALIIFISLAGYFAALLLWPYGLTDPLRHPFESYRVMLSYPDTFKQIFEGREEWSDFMPWYYLPKYMAITIPIIVSLGFLMSVIAVKHMKERVRIIPFFFIIAGVVLPVVFVIIERPNLYSAWRHFLFLYPGIVILAALAYSSIYRNIRGTFNKIKFIIPFIALSLSPLFFIIRYPAYSYLYYNQLVGGLNGAHGNYETDYYYISQREASEWLIKYLEKNNIKDSITVGSNFSTEWFFRKNPQIRNIYIRNEERSMKDWDYAITTSRYISPYKLKNGLWPSGDALKVIYVNNVPVSAITVRKSKSDYHGYLALAENRNESAVRFFDEAVKQDSTDEMIFYNFAVALNRTGEREKADSVLNVCLKLNPGFEPALMYLGNLAAKDGLKDKAREYYMRLISVNRKYFEAYEALGKIDK
jgi:tetratricopeptide (TPR) repeat protein